MSDQYFQRINIQGVVFNLGPETGALVIYCKPAMKGKAIEVRKYPVFSAQASVVERTSNGKPTFVAVFSRLLPGNYHVTAWVTNTSGNRDLVSEDYTVFAGEVAEVDWR